MSDQSIDIRKHRTPQRRLEDVQARLLWFGADDEGFIYVAYFGCDLATYVLIKTNGSYAMDVGEGDLDWLEAETDRRVGS